MAVAKDTDQVRVLKQRVRTLQQKGPLRQRLEIAATRGVPSFIGGGIIGYTEEMMGPEKGAQLTAAMGLGGLAAQILLAPKENTIVACVLQGATSSGLATMAREHGATLARYARLKKAEAQLRAEMARNEATAEIEEDSGRETLDTETTTEERVTG